MKIKFISLIAITAIASACHENFNQEQEFDQIAGMSRTVEDPFDDGIRCEDGCMYFPSAEICLDVMNSITSKDALNDFEEKYNFTSLRSFNDGLIEELSECETMEEYESLWETCTDYLKFEDERVMPRVTSAAYAGIANIDGVFYIGNVKHTVVDETIVVENMDNPTRSNSAVTIDYVVPCNLNDTRAGDEISQRYTDERYQSGKFKVFSRTNLLRHVATENENGVITYLLSFGVQVHVSGQKKKALTGWNSYKDRFFVENLHFDITLPGRRISFLKYRNDYSFSEFGGDIYAFQPVGDEAIPAPDVPSMPAGFNCIVHRARSRSIGNCGAVTDKNVCYSSIYVPLPQCIE